jgi:hypothetical protein
MVNAGAYQQSADAPPALLSRDPANRLFARQTASRLPAEMVRDNALAIAGLLADDIGGPSVKPYQPAGYWQHLNFPRRTWQADTGEKLYRRGLYTHWQRSFLHPSLLAFDAPSREEACVERARSNTPIQALVLLNDPIYVEAARVFAQRVLREGGDGFDARLRFAFRQALSRGPRADEADVLAKLYEQQLSQYRADAKAADELLSVGEYPVPQDADRAQLAAWTGVARVILNLHETIMRY